VSYGCRLEDCRLFGLGLDLAYSIGGVIGTGERYSGVAERGKLNVAMKVFSLVQQLPFGMAAQLVSTQACPLDNEIHLEYRPATRLHGHGLDLLHRHGMRGLAFIPPRPLK
jgi:hypothetical protein